MHIKNRIIKLAFDLFSIFPINKNKIVFLCDGTRYDCNPRYLSEYMGQNTDFIKVWPFFRNVIDKITVPDDVKKVRIFSIRYFFEMATAGVVISNQRTNEILWKKRKGQKYIQTWHSSVRLKKIEGDAEKYLPDEYIKLAVNDSKKTDVILSGCEFSTDIFKRAFWYDGKVEKTGTPRIDYLLSDHSDTIRRIDDFFSLSGPFVLYAPTFREHGELLLTDDDAKAIVEQLSSLTKDTWTFLKRLHPNMRQDNASEDNDKFVKDATNYDAVQELLLSSDYVITDYSSLMFDCAFIHKPCILFVPDYKEYLQKERELYFRLEELPFPIAYSLEELSEILLHFDFARYEKDISEFLNKIGSYEDGHACQRIVAILEQDLNG